MIYFRLSHSCFCFFDYEKSTKRVDKNLLIFLEQTFKDVQNLYRDFAGFDMTSDEYGDLCKKMENLRLYLSLKR